MTITLSPAEIQQHAAWQAADPLVWGGFMLRPGRRSWSRNETTAAPTEPGIYMLNMKDGGVVYIGRATNLHQRLKAHFYNSRFGRANWFDGFTFLRLPEHAVRDVEVAHIYALEPERNELFEPIYWPGHNDMVAALRSLWSIE